jgi:ESCRT-II complex subunit VPS36
MPPPPGTLQPPVPTTDPRPLLDQPSFVVPPAPNADGLFPCPRCTFLNHPALTSCEICGEPLISPNLPPILASAEALDRGTSPAPISIPGTDERTTYVRLSFRAGGEKQFLERIKSAISQKQWTLEPFPAVLPGKPIVGIDGLEKANVALKLRNERVLEQVSFQDLEALMGRAKSLIALAEQLASRVASLPSSGAGAEARRALAESSELLGLRTPIVSREVAGGQEAYLGELARQVAEFLTLPGEGGSLLRREGGIIPLIDLFALYNRARGVALVSPADLVGACGMFERLRLAIRVKTFRSGLIVIMDSGATEEVIERQILTFITTSGDGMTALQVGTKFQWSVGVASELLQVHNSFQ